MYIVSDAYAYSESHSAGLMILFIIWASHNIILLFSIWFGSCNSLHGPMLFTNPGEFLATLSIIWRIEIIIAYTDEVPIFYIIAANHFLHQGLEYMPVSLVGLLVNILLFIDTEKPSWFSRNFGGYTFKEFLRNNEYVLELLGYKWITNNYISSPWLVCRQQSACRLTAVHHDVRCQPRSHQLTVAADRGQSGRNNYRLM